MARFRQDAAGRRRACARDGEIFRNPRLAASYRAIAKDGPDAFYRGPIAEAIAAASKQHGGYMTEKDLADHTSDWVDPVSTNYRGYDVWELPPNGQGIAALEMLNILEQHDLKKRGTTRPTTCICSSKPRSSPSPIGRSSTPIPPSANCRPRS